jgi:hypothetical protein
MGSMNNRTRNADGTFTVILGKVADPAGEAERQHPDLRVVSVKRTAHHIFVIMEGK